jgi:hypothetical protein
VDTAASEALLVRSVEAVSAQRLLDHIAEFARRRKHAGTDGELESLRYVERALAASGYRTETLFHDAYISLPGAARLAALGREHRCITHSFSQPGAIEARLVDVGDGDEAGYASRDARGAVVLVDGIATPASTIAARRHGALAQLHVSPHEHLHEMCVSPVWGSPDDHREQWSSPSPGKLATSSGKRLRLATSRCSSRPRWTRAGDPRPSSSASSTAPPAPKRSFC